MTLTQLWLISTVIPNLKVVLSVFIFLGVVFGAALMMSFFYHHVEYGDVTFPKRITKWFVPIILSILALEVMLPTERQMYIMAGGYVVTNNEQIQKLPNAILKATNAWLEKLEKAAK